MAKKKSSKKAKQAAVETEVEAKKEQKKGEESETSSAEEAEASSDESEEADASDASSKETGAESSENTEKSDSSGEAEASSSEDEEADTSDALSEEEEALRWNKQLGKTLALFMYLIFTVGVLLALFMSLFRAVTAKPKVLAGFGSSSKYMKVSKLKQCVKRLRGLDRELEHESAVIWYRVRKGHRHYLTAWNDWARDWRRRMLELRRQCPLQGRSEIARAFRRASRNMLELQSRQEKTFRKFYKNSMWLFREVRQGLHLLKEELR